MRTSTDRENGSRRIVHTCEGESRTEQAHKNEVDINQIVSRYQKSGMLPQRDGHASYGDFTQIVDYHTACMAVDEAERSFLELPAELRKRFANDPGRLIAFLAKEDNREEAERLGLIERVIPPQPPQLDVNADVPPLQGPQTPSAGQTPPTGTPGVPAT